MRSAWPFPEKPSTCDIGKCVEEVSKPDFEGVAGVGNFAKPAIHFTGASLRSSPGHPEMVLKLLLVRFRPIEVVHSQERLRLTIPGRIHARFVTSRQLGDTARGIELDFGSHEHL
jgi:hypothetical protein